LDYFKRHKRRILDSIPEIESHFRTYGIAKSIVSNVFIPKSMGFSQSLSIFSAGGDMKWENQISADSD
jgi:hypothetical protein